MNRISARLVATVATLGLLISSPAMVSAVTTTPTPAQLTAEIVAASKTATSVNLASQLTGAANSSYEQGPCVQSQSAPGDRFTSCDFGTTSASKTVVLLGDSQASMWLPAFDAAGKAHNFHVILLSRLGCNSNPIVLKSFSGSVDAGCAVFRTATLKYIKTLTAPLVFVAQIHRFAQYANGTAVTNAAWTASMNTFFASLKSAGATVSFIEPAPVSPVDAAGCLSRNIGASQKCTFTLDKGVVADSRASDDAAVVKSKVTMVNTFSLFCTATAVAATTKCPAQVAGLLVYSDRWHTTTQYATHVWQAMAALTKL
jgi:hypothetical protein